MTTCNGDDDVHRALAAGANGYILKDLMHKDFVHAIHGIHKGGRWIVPEPAEQLAENSPRIELTLRELEVLLLLEDRNRNKETVDVLFFTEDAIKFHVKSFLGKLGVNDRTRPVTVAIRRGMLHMD